jgi:hypothetical protein
MIPIRHSSIFKSRWMALLWAAGMIWFALDVAEPPATAGNTSAASDQATDVTGAPISSDDERKIADIVGNL